MSEADIQLTASIDFTGAEKQAAEFVTKMTKTLKDINAKASAPGGSLFRPGGNSGAGGFSGSSTVDLARQSMLSTERAYQSALTRTEAMLQRIGRQANGNAEMSDRARAALSSYNSTLQTFGTRSMEGVRAQGSFARQMGVLNSELAASSGLLVTLHRGFGSLSSQLATVASGVSVVGGRVGAVAGSFAGVASAAGVSTRALAAFSAAAAPVAAVVVVVAALAAGVLTAGAAMADTSDRFNLLVGKLNAATGSMSSANALFAEAFAIAQKLGAPLDDVGTALNRFASAGKELGVTNQEVARLAESFLKLSRASGQTTAEAMSSLTQLTQFLGSGRGLSGDELKSLGENMQPLLRAIAKEMGVATGQLKDLGAQGVISADIVLSAMRKMTSQINDDFANLGESVSQINARIGNEWDMLLSNLDKRLHLSDLYKFMLKLPLMALEGANKLVGQKTGTDRAQDLQGKIADVDDKIRRTPFEWARKGLREQRAELVKEYDALATDLVRQQVDAGQQTIDAENKAWQNRVDTAKRGAKELLAANDPIVKANEEYRTSVEKLDKAKPFISKEDYQETLDAITATRDAAIERAEKAANKLTMEEKAVWSTTKAYDALRLELSNAKIATEALQSGDMTIIDVKANERVTDFLIDFAKRANVVGKSLEELAAMAGVSLGELREGFRGIEVEAAKRNALKRSKDLGTETEETKRLAQATLQGAKAEAEMSKAIEVERQIRALGLDAKDKDLAALREEIRTKLAAAEAAKEYQRAAQEGQSILEQYGDGATQLRLKLERLNETRRILSENGGLSAEMAEAFNRATLDAVKSANTMQGAMLRAFDHVGEAITDTFAKAFEKGKLDAKDLMKDLKSIFGRFVIEAVFTPPVTPLKGMFMENFEANNDNSEPQPIARRA